MLSGLVSSGLTGPTRSRARRSAITLTGRTGTPIDITLDIAAGRARFGEAIRTRPSGGATSLAIESGSFPTYGIYFGNNGGPNFSFNSGSQIISFDGRAVLPSSYVLGWSTTGNGTSGTNQTQLFSDAVGIIAQRNGAAAQSFLSYNTYTSATSYERGVFDWITTANTLRIGTEKGSGGGTARDLVLVTDGTTRLTIGATTGNVTLTAPITLKGYTVATLPTGVQGHKAFVTDALGPTYLVAVVAGGAVITEVFYNGTAWVCT